MWLFRRNKFKRLNREDLVNSICELERQERTVEAEVLQKIKEIDALMAKEKMKRAKICNFSMQKRLHISMKKNKLPWKEGCICCIISDL